VTEGASGPPDPGTTLTHLDGSGRARMVDITAKQVTARLAVARCRVVGARPVDQVLAGAGPLGDLVEEARVAGALAAKATWRLIPLCHPIRIGDVAVRIEPGPVTEVTATATALDRTGVEMEALTACAVAALSLVGACISADPLVHLEDLAVVEKSGGRSGTWTRQPDGTVSRVAPPER